MDLYGHLYNEMQDVAAQLMDEIVTPVQVELTEVEIASPGKACPGRSEWERRIRNDKSP